MEQNIISISTEVMSEVESQRVKWGVVSDDRKNTPWMWAAYIAQYATGWMNGSFDPLRRNVTDDFRSGMIKVAALAISAADSVDRQRADNGSTFYESTE